MATTAEDGKYRRFMNIKASAHQIHKKLEASRLSPGVNWSGSNKISMAEAYATGETHGRPGNKPTIPDSTVELLEAHFGKKKQ